MEYLSNSLNISDHLDFMGLNGFVWWYGVVEDRKDPLYLGRVKVRCIGFHTDDKNLIPTNDLPWAQVIQPITSAGISGIGSSPIGPLEGTHVFGFFRDGIEGQEPVVLGTCVGIPSTVANRYRGFFDPRNFNKRKKDPYPPLFVDRQNDGSSAKIIEHADEPLKVQPYYFTGVNSFAKKNAKLIYEKDFTSDKVLAKIVSDDGEELYSEQSYSPHPNENFMRFDTNGSLSWSLPSIPLMAQGKADLGADGKTIHPFAQLFVNSSVINRSIEEARKGLHSQLVSLIPNPKQKIENTKTWSVRSSCFDPEYPFNHVNYTESGHLFEMDDTPNHERVRLLHRSMSYLEYMSNGDKVDNVVGDSYYANDSNRYTHIIGSDFQNIGGGLSLYLNARNASGNDSVIRVGQNSGLTIEAVGGDINISAKGNLNLRGSKVNTFTDASDSIDNRNYIISGQGFKVENSNQTDIESDTFNVSSKSKILMNTDAYTLNSKSGISLKTPTGNISMSALSLSEEVITGVVGLTSKSIKTTLGKMSFSCLDPTPITGGGFTFKIGPEVSLLPTPAVSEMSLNPLSYEVNLRGPKSEVKIDTVGKTELKSVTGFTVEDFTSVKLGVSGFAQSEISMDAAGFISIKNTTTSLFEILNELLTQLQSLTVGTGTGPSTPPINSSQFQAIQQKLTKFMK